MKNRIVFMFCIVFIGILNPINGAEEMPATYSFESLSSDIANQIAVAAVAECTKRNFKASAAVVGRDGNLLAFLRNPFAGPHTILVSQKKAYTAATTQVRTSQLMSRTDLSFAPGMLLIIGGVPIKFNGKFYGGVAVSGATPEIDEKCADAGIAAVKEIMDFVD